MANIVLVHGAFGDGSHWRHVIPGLHQAGHRVMAAQNPLTSLADDVANTRKLAEWMEGPYVAGRPFLRRSRHHRRGPCVQRWLGLVYVAGFAPDEGESLDSILAGAEPPPGAPRASARRSTTTSCGTARTRSTTASAVTSTTPSRWSWRPPRGRSLAGAFATLPGSRRGGSSRAGTRSRPRTACSGRRASAGWLSACRPAKPSSSTPATPLSPPGHARYFELIVAAAGAV